jgi:uncharacterized NAD-dependent epimerase/dehydratase family protein
MYLKPTARLAIYAEGEFGRGRSKTAEGVIRYGKNPIAAIVDSTAVGKTVKEAINIDCPAPVVGSIQEALKHKPDALLIGTAWSGGKLPQEWRRDILEAIKAKLDIVNGLHDFLCDDPEFSSLAKEHNVRLLDVRKPPSDLPVGEGKARKIDALTVLTVGTDCSVGKMTVSLELCNEAQRRGFKAKFVATGQTGIMIAGGDGIAIDRVIGDFMAGATEKMVLEAAPGQDFVFVEGQGSLAHPSFSGVTLALMHGSAAKAMILCHKATRTCINGLADFPQPDFNKMIEVTQTMAAFVQPTKVLGIAVNTRGMDDAEARKVVEDAQRQTGLPATDCVRFGAKPLFDAILAFQEKQKCLAPR